MSEVALYRVFYVNHGKFFVSIVEHGSIRQAITKHHPTFQRDCLWMTRSKALRLIKRSKSRGFCSYKQIWGIVDKNGVQEIIN